MLKCRCLIGQYPVYEMAVSNTHSEALVAKWTFVGFLLLFAGAAQAQSSAPPLEQPQRQLLSCSGFKYNADGSWTAVKPMIIGTATVNPGDSIRPGAATGGIDLAAKLTANCPHYPGLE
ncbi:MAG: hypothetical protein WDN46_09470 [Methylocella sp.]